MVVLEGEFSRGLEGCFYIERSFFFSPCVQTRSYVA
jgi:hypothetical protein